MKSNKKKKGVDLGTLFRSINAAWGLGFVIALPPVIFVFIGIFLDRFLKTEPILTIIFLLFGVVAGVYAGIKETKEIID